jgi:ATP-dependent exoDNAse (exonuclease V) beta subunit
MSKMVDLQEWLQQNEKVEKQESKLFLTEKELRAFPKYKNASDEEVQNAILTFHKLALICYHAFCKEENSIDLPKAA